MNLPFDNGNNIVMLLAGILFGYFLEVGGLGSPRKLAAQFSLRDWTVFKVMFTAIVVTRIIFDYFIWNRKIQRISI